MNKKYLFVLSLVILNITLFISSCDSPAPNLEIPNASDVRKINVSLKGDTSPMRNPLCVIKNTNQIKEILKFVHKHNNKWQYPTILPMPSLPYELEFSGSGRNSLLVIWLDGKTNTLGGINEGDSRLKSLSSSELQEIITLIHAEPTCTQR